MPKRTLDFRPGRGGKGEGREGREGGGRLSLTEI